MVKARLYLVRHGETNENKQKIIQGQLDTLLNEEGLYQAGLAAIALKDVPFDVAYTSSLQRASKVWLVVPMIDHSELELKKQSELMERHMGHRQGVVYGTFLDHPGENFDGSTGENNTDFINRCKAWWEGTIEAYVSSQKPRPEPYNILAVSHGGFLGVLVERYLLAEGRIGLKGEIDSWNCLNASITTLELDEDGRWLLERYSDVSHLTEVEEDATADAQVILDA